MPSALQIVQRFYPHVHKVVDAKRDVEITITPKDLSKSRLREHNECAIAVAAMRELQVDGALISTRTAYLIKGTTAIRFTVPEHVARELIAFDRGAQFAAGEYTLYKPLPRRPRGSGTRNTGSLASGKLKHQRSQTADIRAPLGSAKP